MLDVHSSPHRHETQFSNAAAFSVCAMGGGQKNQRNKPNYWYVSQIIITLAK